MSEEIERIINECSCVDTFDYVITPQQRDTMLLAEYIKELQQENQQLKEKVAELTNDWNEQIKLTNQENLDCSKYAVENHHLKSVLDEIKELSDKYEMGRFDYLIPVFEIKMILDKVKK